MSAGAERVQRIVAPVVAGAGFDLEQVDVQPAGSRRIVRVVVDRAGGVDLDAAAGLSRLLSVALDDADPLGAEPYVLEVTSPGVDRPLTAARHWQRAVGRLVEVRHVDGTTTRGRLLDADGNRCVLDTDGQHVTVPMRDVHKAQVQVEFHRPDDSEGR